MHLAKRVALVATVFVFSAGIGTGCKKESAKKDDPATKTGEEKASGSGSAAAAEKKDDKPVVTAAMSGFRSTMSAAAGDTGKGMGGLGAKLGGMFGASAAIQKETTGDGVARAGATAADEGEPAAADDSPPGEHKEIKFPPAGAAGGDCDKVTERLMIIINQMFGDSDDQAQAAEMQTMLMTMCTEQKWSQELKDCALAAMSEADLDACEKYVPEDMGGGEDYEYPEPPAVEVAAWTGGDDCDSVGKRLMMIASAQMGELPAEYKAELEVSLAESARQVSEMCTEGKWSDEVRKCIVGAGSMQVAEECMGNLGGGNTGDGNKGDNNQGVGNLGTGNTGDGNKGDNNAGERNSGGNTTGDRNSGNTNTGSFD